MIKSEFVLSLMMVEKPRNQKIPNMQMLNLENKRQIIIVVSFNVVFPSQIVFISITFITFPPNNRGKKIASEMVGTSFLVKTIGHI